MTGNDRPVQPLKGSRYKIRNLEKNLHPYPLKKPSPASFGVLRGDAVRPAGIFGGTIFLRQRMTKTGKWTTFVS
ncbi:MAG: hypothetical protein A2X25_00925 [Chloroflexi bacterium GWB2_49_20]|nr:MAG: hypothetical protein A2X25_00925 [Chloroflexi bacterium GWB2_49_20]OGN77526.1 MAG: hypothetical protein A2X26_02175 [Chloroflexi bacterium GWC2_49_37]OGN83211.1 MAG: hypothetical protein A2X27_13545 [Chloroflexi bacterium GWD2_49_16]